MCHQQPLSLAFLPATMPNSRGWKLFSDLPPDIARTIVEFAACSFKTARALLVTSKALSQWAIPLLYTRVHLLKESSAAKFLAALDASLDSSSPARGQYVKHLIVSSYLDPVLGRDLLPDILAHTTALRSFTWTGDSGRSPPRSALPLTLKTLNISFSFFDTESWPHDEFTLNPSFWNIEELQIATVHEWDPTDTILRTFSFVPFVSLKYLSIRSPTVFGPSAALVAHIREVLIPQFPPTLKVCVLYDFIRRGEEHDGSLSIEMKQLIMGSVDDRIIVSTDGQVKLSPGAPYSDFLIRTSKNNPFVGHSWSKTRCHWEELVSLIERRRQVEGALDAGFSSKWSQGEGEGLCREDNTRRMGDYCRYRCSCVGLVGGRSCLEEDKAL
ncbi:hypothetical protein DL96DRAFT_1607870, partial [Flagelloscypha sp. PMI_526]